MAGSHQVEEGPLQPTCADPQKTMTTLRKKLGDQVPKLKPIQQFAQAECGVSTIYTGLKQVRVKIGAPKKLLRCASWLSLIPKAPSRLRHAPEQTTKVVGISST